jgi:hypothetical protein
MRPATGRDDHRGSSGTGFLAPRVESAENAPVIYERYDDYEEGILKVLLKP